MHNHYKVNGINFIVKDEVLIEINQCILMVDTFDEILNYLGIN